MAERTTLQLTTPQSSVRRRLWHAAVALASAAGAAAAETPADDRARSDDDIRIPEIFASTLPGTMRRHQLRLVFHPRFGDFERYDYVRLPLVLRYGLSDRWQVEGEVQGYFSHGLSGPAFFEEYGFSRARLETKYRFERQLLPSWDTAVGAEVSRPISNPPPGTMDGLRHHRSYITFARRLEARPQIRVFWEVMTDFVDQTEFEAKIRANEPRDDTVGLSAGFVWDRPSVHYTFETSALTTRLFGQDDEDIFYLRPGIIWDIPQRYTFYGKGQWQIGVGTRMSFGPDGTDVGFSGKLRINFDAKRWFRRSAAGR